MFLATTAIREFWDTEQELVYLGLWCLDPSDIDLKDSGTNNVIPYFWDDLSKNLGSHYEKALEIYHKMLPCIVTSMNHMHGVNKSSRYYEIILGYWLLQFIHIIFDRYICIKKALELYPELSTIVLSENSYHTPDLPEKFEDMIHDDFINLQIFSQILKAMEYKFPQKELSHVCNHEKQFRLNQGKGKTVHYRILTKITKLLSYFSKEKLTLTDTYFTYRNQQKTRKLLVNSGFSLVMDNMDYALEIDFRPTDKEARNKICNDYKAENIFERVLISLLRDNMPKIYVEYFGTVRQKVSKLPITKTAAYYTSIAQTVNHVFKFHVAENIDSSRLMIHQHGGGYGLHEYNMNEDYNTMISDRFLTWGWTEKDKQIPLAHPKLCNPKKNCQDCTGVLLPLTFMPLYLHRMDFAYSSSNFVKYMRIILDLINKLDSAVPLKIRSHELIHKKNWKLAQRIWNRFPHLKNSDPYKDFVSSASNSNCVIATSFGTIPLETMNLDIPTVIVLDRSIFAWRKSAQPYMRSLEEAGILFYSIEQAASHVIKNYEDINVWWNDQIVKKIRSEFLKKYARKSSDWVREWDKLIKLQL